MKHAQKSRLTAAAAVTALVAASGLLAGCGGSESASAAPKTAEDLLAMPEIDDSDGLVIDGEQIADADLLEAARDGEVQWYTAMASSELSAERFEAETGVPVTVTRLPSGKFFERILSEHGAGRLGGDVVQLTDPLMLEQLAADGVLVDYQVPKYDELAAMDNVVFDDGKYYTTYYSAYAFGYNSSAIPEEEAPQNWSDLLDPSLKGKEGIVNAGAGGTVQGLADFQEQVLGPDYWSQLAAQEPRIYDTTSVQIEAMSRGEITAATAGYNNLYDAERAGAPIKLVVPEEGVSGTLTTQGLTTTGEDNPAAQLLMNWTMSKSGQEFAAAQGFVASRTDVEQVPTGDYQLPSSTDPNFFVYTPDMAKEKGEDIVARWNQAFDFNG
jgi:iron(III) transport system substrate-binding protein